MRPAPPRGFHDAHTHLSAGADDLCGVDLRELRATGTIAEAIAAWPAEPGAWIRGWGWDGATPVTDARPGHPTFLARRDGHAAWLNGAARAALALPKESEVVCEEAFDAARRRLPERSTGERVAAIDREMTRLAASGLTSADDMVEPWGPEIYARLRDRHSARLSIGMWLPESLPAASAESIRREFPEGGRVAVRGIKIFLDGTLGARTAALFAPYADDPDHRGVLRIREREIPERVRSWAARGWPVALHAIGDRAVALALDALERAPRPSWGAHRIEHAQVVRRSDLPRFGASRIVASVQPGHWLDDSPWIQDRLGAREEAVVHPLASLAAAGAELALGSDWPVSDADPRRILEAATAGARGGEALSADAAAAWYTSRPR